jgi:dTMP kinase
MKSGLFVFEGADGVGKTSIIELLHLELKRQGYNVKKIGFPGYSTGTLGNLIYQIHERPNKFNLKSINPCSLQLLHVAAHIDTIQMEIIPALESHKIILLDRYWWSTFIYGKYSGVDETILNRMIEIEKHYWSTNLPDALFLIKRVSKPLKKGIDINHWGKLQEAYDTLSVNEKGKYSIIEIDNEISIEISRDIILEEILKRES